ncbi:MAG TPA: M1 family metallopeptidase, partial [Kofleriaceae bacterium]|nr:M1 family metallopeptidase [Kofleriaceae bacterium]
MKHRMLALAVLIGCGPSKPAVTVPAPPTTAAPTAEAPPAVPDGLAPPRPTLRLPRNFLPTGYAVRMEIDPAQAGFEASIQITGKVSERSRVIWLNGRRLKVHKAVAKRDGQPDVPLTVAGGEGDDEYMSFTAVSPLDAGEWTLAIAYAGDFDALNTAGAFKQTVAGKPYVYSQFEAIYARRAFPCFDEPDNKVPWKVTLDVPSALVAVSNAPEASTKDLGGGKKRVKFAPTKPLPSYLIAFGVGPFDVVDAGKSQHGTPVRIVALNGRAADAKYAAKTSTTVINYLEDYFGMPYPYDKVDMLTIPLTVGFGAMENAGLITYTETLVLMDDKASQERHEGWIGVAAHELGHQWFGDLVTMDFWNDIWLNEGFATWVQQKISQRFEPKWHLDQAPLDRRNVALDNDSLVSARQIRQPIKSPDDILTVFDRITYDKGASVLNMFEGFVGPEKFRQGIHDYLTAHAYGNATSTDFVAAISKAAGQDVSPGFATFLEQAGTPEITATTSCEGGKASVALSQQRYLPPGAGEPPAHQPWIVPVCVAFDQGGKRGEACTLLDKEQGSIALDTKSCPRWMMPNVNGRGYYRDAYTAAQATALRDEAWGKLSWLERRAVFSDVHDAAFTGKLPLQLALSLVPKMLAGNDRFTVGPATRTAAELSRDVPDELRPKYEAWLRQTFGPGARQAGVAPKANDTIDTEATRSELITAAAWHGHDAKLTADAVKLADKWRDLPQSVRGDVLQIAVDASPAVFDRIYKEVTSETDRSKRSEMLRALSSVRDTKRQTTALGLVLDPKLDPRETLGMLFGGGGGRRGGGGGGARLGMPGAGRGGGGVAGGTLGAGG